MPHRPLIDAPSHSGASITPMHWRVFFMPREAQTWWDYISPFNFRHCLAMAYCVASESWLVYDPADRRTCLTVIPVGEAFDDFHAAVWNASSLILGIEARDGNAYAHRWGQWCSSQIGRLLGIPGSAWRPLALAKTLLNQNAEVLKDVSQGESSGRRS